MSAEPAPPALSGNSAGPASPSSCGHLPRLASEFYRGNAVVFWTYTFADRRTGWLDARFHAVFRELLLHTAARESLLCPVYTLMPDHVHLIWMGIEDASDQRRATSFLRTQLARHLAPARWQHQPHDSVLRDEARRRGAFVRTCAYVAENPVRAGLATSAAAWSFTGCVVPGYPKLHPLEADFWPKFWRIYAAALERGRTEKIAAPARLP